MTLKILEIVNKWGKQRQPLQRVYRKLCDRELFLAAYGKLYANRGATTPGTDSTDTVDGMSLARIDKLIGQLKTGTYHWKAVRRTYVKKRNGGQRPLGLPGWNDKLVQEVIRTILEAYYEPRFSDCSHGFRPGRGCHTALLDIHRHWNGTKWFIEGDIKGCFDNINHAILLTLLERDMPDPRFLQLIKEMLEVGYIEDWQHQHSYSGVPQGGVISPILSNIVLNELDEYVETTLIPAYTKGNQRRKNPTYAAIMEARADAWVSNDVELYQMLTQQMRQLPSVEPNDENYRRLRYCRYADDFLLGFAGPKHEAEAIKDEIAKFLRRLQLTLSPDKTLITHAATQRARFLGYELGTSRSNTKLTQDQNSTRKRRTVNGTVQLYVPRQVSQTWVNRYKRNGKTRHRFELESCSDYEIVMSYHVEFQGLVNYYLLAVDVAKRLYPVRYVFLESLVKTLAHKHKQKPSWVYRRYKTQFETGMTGLEVSVPREVPQPPLVARFGAIPIRRDKTAILCDEKPTMNYSGNELIRRLLANECELCGSHDDIEVHHLRKLADIKRRYQGQKAPPPWAVFMMTRHRKTIVVCRSCHQDITYGRYDGPKLV
jgi:group II intron reverse transcriptase/maturase